MIKCDAASLTLKLTNLRNVTIENCTFGNWTFRQVGHVIVKNSRSSTLKNVPTSLNFYNSSGLIENISINDLNFTNMPKSNRYIQIQKSGLMENIAIKDVNFANGLIIQNNSYIQITKSEFTNNTVNFGLIKVLNSSKLEMSNCTLRKNKAIHNAGAIYADRSFIYVTNTNFSDNSAIRRGGALLVKEGSFVFLKRCIFSYNQVKIGYTGEKIEKHYGGAISLSNSTLNGDNVNFTGNKAYYGGGLACFLYSKVTAQYMHFSHNIATYGSAIYGSISCKFSCKNCSLYENQNLAVNNVITGAAISLYNHSTINVSTFKCENNIGHFWGCIFATEKSSVFVYDAIFSMNIGNAILLVNDSYLLAVNASFINNTTPGPGGAICSVNSTLNISRCFCYHNKRMSGGAFTLTFSTAVLTYCTFSNNSNKALAFLDSTSASIVNCTFENNFSPDIAGALLINTSSNVSVSHTTFQKNSAGTGGAVAVFGHSLLVLSNCSFTRNLASNIRRHIIENGLFGEGGAICIVRSVLKIFQSQFYNNFADMAGGSLFCGESLLLIHDSVFQNNIATILTGGAIIVTHSSLTIEDSSLVNNSIQYEIRNEGGGLAIFTNSTAKIMDVRLFENKGAFQVEMNCQVTIFNSSFIDNTGHTISVKNSVYLQMDHCRVLNNSGTAVYLASSSINITNAKFNHNTEGALLLQESSEASFCNCSFTDNSASKGGALSAVASNIEFIACNFIGNSATNGGVFSISGNLFLKNCVVTNNTAHGDGGVGYLEEHSKINITTSIFRKNSALGSGGVFRIRNITAIVWNSSFVSNSAGTNGGVIYAEYFSLINTSQTTYYGNKAGTSGVFYVRTGKVFVKHSMIQQNLAHSCAAMTIDATSLEISFSQVNKNKVGAFCVINSSLFISKSSFFKENRNDLGLYLTIGTISLGSSMGYLENCTFLLGDHRIGAVSLTTSELRLPNTVMLQNIVQIVTDINIVSVRNKFINRIYTYKSLMRHGNKLLKSDTTNFKQIAIKEDFIFELNKNIHQSSLATKETQFASSEFFLLYTILLQNFNLFVTC